MFDLKELRTAFGRFLTGVTVVTTRAPDGTQLGFTANSFTSVSLDPPLLLVCPGKHLSSFDAFTQASKFGVSILAEGQEDVSNLFASGSGDRFAAVNCDTPLGNIPLIQGRAAGFVCDSFERVDAGDHVILIGRVTHFDDAALPGLGYGPNGYFSQSRERNAEAPQSKQTRASALFECGDGILMDSALDLFTVDVPVGQSPLQTLRVALAAQGITTAMNVVYAVYDEPENRRRIVFRGRSDGAEPGLKRVDIETLPHLPIEDAALKSLLARFAQEHKSQNFGLYVGDDESGDILPAQER